MRDQLMPASGLAGRHRGFREHGPSRRRRQSRTNVASNPHATVHGASRSPRIRADALPDHIRRCSAAHAFGSRIRGRAQLARNEISTDDIRTTYDEFTGAYARIWDDNLHVGYWSDDAPDAPVPVATDRLNGELLTRLLTQPGDRVLDVGCGIGTPAMRLARERDVSVVGITISAYQVQRATDAAQAAGLADRVSFTEADVRSMPFADESFDAVWALESLHHVPDRRVALGELHRVLRPGKYLAIGDFALRHAPRGSDAEVIEGFRAAGGVATLTVIEDILADLRSAGFELQSLVDVGDHVRPTMSRHAELFRAARPHLEARMGVVGLDEMISRNEQLADSRAFSYILLGARRPPV